MNPKYHCHVKQPHRKITVLFEEEGWIVGTFPNRKEIYIFCSNCMYFQSSERQVHGYDEGKNRCIRNSLFPKRIKFILDTLSHEI